MYKMQAGMGDTVFTPLYEVLKRRGVRFEFFHAVTRLGLASDRPRIDSIDVVPQVELAADEYDPLVDVDGLACWPSQPRWEQLADGEALRRAGTDFELDPNPLDRPPVRLARGTDFDQAVLGIPIGALPPICEELIERDERFRRAIESAVTVQTQAFQVWANRPTDELGWEHDPNSVAGCYVEPLDTYCDMSHLIPRESWGDGDGVRAIGYFCGVLPERSGEAPAEATERAKANAIEFLERDIGALWPASRGAGAGVPFDWSLLGDREGRTGRERFDAQYWRANATGSERYVLTTAGTVEHRLPSDESGFENLMLAGDWTKNGVDGGCVEAAAISGMQAARGLVGVESPIPGESPGWLRPGVQGLPPYVEYGGRATSPGPFLSLGGRLRGFVLQGDRARIGELVRRTLDEPAGRGVDYRPLGSRVLLLVGGFERVSSMTAPFDRWGTVQEIQASFWVPVVAGEDRGDVFVAERLGLALPYILVDNPMSYLGGRENYGYAKTMGRFEPPDALGDRMRVETFGGNFGRQEGAGWHTFLEIAPGAGHDGGGAAIDGPMDLLRHVAGDVLRRNAEGEIVLPGMRFTATLVDDIREGRMRQVFLKQFRDAADGSRACYQSVVETPIEVQRRTFRPSGRDWDITLRPLDSHPIDQEMGLTSQRASVAFEGELDMVVKNGIEVGRVAAAPGVPTPVGPSPAPVTEGDGVVALIETTARWIGRELSAIEARLRRL
jgi:Flavin containing amine oxidoreductase